MIASLEVDRANECPEKEMPFHKDTKLHKMLMESEPDKIASMLLEEKRAAAQASSGIHISSSDLLSLSPREVWPKIVEVGKKLAEKTGAEAPRERMTEYYASQFVKAINELSGTVVKNTQLKEVLSEIPSVLVDSECKSMMTTLKAHDPSKGSDNGSRSIEGPVIHQTVKQDLGRG
jgi:hypothetical protein